MRHFRHLRSAEISDLIASFTSGRETKADLARRYEVDHSTVIYHIKKYQDAYPEQGGIYAYMKAKERMECIHPSGRCSVCGQMWDKLERKERATIRSLTTRLKSATDRLQQAGVPWND